MKRAVASPERTQTARSQQPVARTDLVEAIDRKLEELRVLREFVTRGQAAQAACDTIIKREERKIRRARAGS
ncbi:MAG TPA: hypothetical protein VK752_05380 [Bryobacteraceae bacterium]|nr:hypothetical protein [Bryobacteraceae bacterium]